MSIETITMTEARTRMAAQGMSEQKDMAFVCPICATVQSMRSLVLAGADRDKVDRSIGFSCEGRFSDAGPWPASKDKSAKATKRRSIRGCDWSLGGLFKLHNTEIEHENGSKSPTFAIATPEQAQSLAASLTKETT
jgi:hypothetical protein